MELDDMKSYWQHVPAETGKSAEALKNMIKESRHPVLKGIRRQLVIEMAGWILFVVVFYDFFDGHKRALSLNLLVLSAGILVVVHNAWGYLMARNLETDGNLTQALSRYLARTRNYAMISIASRVVSMTAVLMFFADTIQFTKEKYMMLAGIIVVFMVQTGILYRLWIKRIAHLQRSLQELQQA